MIVPPTPYRSPNEPTCDRSPWNSHPPMVLDNIIRGAWRRTKYPNCGHNDLAANLGLAVFKNRAGPGRINGVFVTSIEFKNWCNETTLTLRTLCCSRMHHHLLNEPCLFLNAHQKVGRAPDICCAFAGNISPRCPAPQCKLVVYALVVMG